VASAAPETPLGEQLRRGLLRSLFGADVDVVLADGEDAFDLRLEILRWPGRDQ
jgi:hypothetical protein